MAGGPAQRRTGGPICQARHAAPKLGRNIRLVTRNKVVGSLGPDGRLKFLSANLVMAYNTSHLQRTLGVWKRQSGREVDAKLQRFISPMGFEHINFNGVIVFPFEHYPNPVARAAMGHSGPAQRRGSAEP